MKSIRNSSIYLIHTLLAAIVFLALTLGPGTARAQTLPPSTTSDWSSLLDTGWTCGQLTGSRWNQWKKSVLLFAASNGYAFKGRCDQLHEGNGAPRQGSVLVTFRDTNNVAQYVAWYDSKFDRNNHQVFGGFIPLNALTYYDIRQQPIKSYPLYDQAAQQSYFQWLQGMTYMPPGMYQSFIDRHRSNILQLKGCVTPYSVCGTSANVIPLPNGGSATIDIRIEDPSGTIAYGKIWETYPDKPSFLERFAMVGLTVGLTIVGGGIGEYVGLLAGTAEHAAFAAGFASFTSGIMQGQDVDQALLSGVKGSALAYTGTLVLNAYGDPNALVGVKGLGCPTGDGCWYLKMANGFPPLKHLAELHDPFINWSEGAFGSIAQNGWYKAVTIAPFVVPGCLASNGCVAAGITIAREDEID